MQFVCACRENEMDTKVLASAYHQRGVVQCCLSNMEAAVADIGEAYTLDRGNQVYKAHMSQLAHHPAMNVAGHGPSRT
eukprot:COSAG01_NODE_10315_length_2194_cov_13.921241_2_plen_78_part_00